MIIRLIKRKTYMRLLKRKLKLMNLKFQTKISQLVIRLKFRPKATNKSSIQELKTDILLSTTHHRVALMKKFKTLCLKR